MIIKKTRMTASIAKIPTKNTWKRNKRNQFKDSTKERNSIIPDNSTSKVFIVSIPFAPKSFKSLNS
jgi:hypothetical protein